MAADVNDVGDLLNATLEDIEKEDVNQTFEYSSYGLTKFFFEETPKSANGNRMEFDIRVRAADSARFVGLYESTPNKQKDLTLKGYERWSHIESKIHWDEKELAMNSGAEKVYDLLEERYNGSKEDNANLIEEALPLPPTSATNLKQLRGLLYHIRTLGVGVSDTVGGFNGTTVIYLDGSTETMWCELDRNVPENTRLRNFVGTYSGETDQDLVKILRKAMNRTKFSGIAGIKGKSDNDVAIAWGQNRHEAYEDAVNRRAIESTKDDIAPITTTRFRGASLVQVPVFDSLAFDPIVGLKKKSISARLLGGRYMKKKSAINDRDQVEVWTVPMVTSTALRCVNPRELFVIHKVR